MNSNVLPFITEQVDLTDLPGTQPDDGMIRAAGLIPVELNERIKAMARKQNKLALHLIGELIIKAAGEIEQWEAEQEAARLQQRFGDNWLQILQSVNCKNI